jgi:uroporphyrinogen-III synthase
MRVLVTRPEEQAETTARRLARLGHHACIAPVLEIAPTGAALPSGPFDMLLATSARAFYGARLSRSIRALPLACVGQKTADVGQEFGLSAFCVAPNGEALAAALLHQGNTKSALYLAGRERKPDLENLLRKKGFRIEVCETYEARPAAAWPEHVRAALERGEIDAVLHFSTRSATIALQLMGAELAKSLLHFCLSGDVALACKDWAPPAQILAASHPDEDSLFDLLQVRQAGPGDEKA